MCGFTLARTIILCLRVVAAEGSTEKRSSSSEDPIVLETYCPQSALAFVLIVFPPVMHVLEAQNISDLLI